jgi:Ca2+-binding RTX toxin-like protein
MAYNRTLGSKALLSNLIGFTNPTQANGQLGIGNQQQLDIINEIWTIYSANDAFAEKFDAMYASGFGLSVNSVPGKFVGGVANIAGQLAIGKVLESANGTAKDGVLTNTAGSDRLTVDLDPAKWITGTANTAMDVKGRDTLATDLMFAVSEDNLSAGSGASAQFANLYARPMWTAANSSNITKAVFATTAAATSISETAAPNAKSGAKGGVILVGNTGADTLQGGDGVDLIVANDNAVLIAARAG